MQPIDNANRIAIVGAGGQFGRHLCESLGEAAIGLRRHQLDIASRAQVQSTLLRLRPRLIINAAAFTNVDGAEDEVAKCRAVNVDGVAHLTEVCRAIECPLVHISTDYVFGGDTLRRQPYREDDAPQPVNAYGRAKLEGEAIAGEWPQTFIIRTCGLYGGMGEADRPRNFVGAMMQLAK